MLKSIYISLLTSFQCEHSLCRDCYANSITSTTSKDKKQFECPECGETIAQVKQEPYSQQGSRDALESTCQPVQPASSQGISVLSSKEAKKRNFGDDCNGMQPSMGDLKCHWFRLSDKLDRVTRSSKTNAAINITKKWQTEAPEDKIVIFAEWLGTAKILGRMLEKEGINFLYYNGGLPILAREKNLGDFKTKPGIKVMVRSAMIPS